VKYAVVTFGCRVNQADSLAIEADLQARGAVAVMPEEAELVVINTCSVTATADQGARQTIRRVARDNPSARIVATGCYATRRPEEVGALPNVVRVVPNDDKSKTIALLSTDFGLTTAVRFGEGEGSCGAAIEPGVAGRTAFTLRVQTGCGQSCSYCIIPSTRGRPRSVGVDQVLADISRVASAGFKEIALTGVHLGSYGRDLQPASSLFELLQTIHREMSAAGLLFRISSLEPMDCTRDIVDLVANGRTFAPHFHLPLQHASNRLLEAMCRPYTIEYYATLVDDIRRRIPHASIGSDVIVGFPGESERDFDELVEYLQRSPLTHLHVFPYSDRPGTQAATLTERVPGAIVRERGRRIREISRCLSARFHDIQAGTVRPALTVDDGSTVVTDNYLKLRIAPGRARNELLHVRVLSPHDAVAVEISPR
jgi:threonylcarbamoyladenosine tRNA methylthiotransferase MtaB